MRVGIEFARRAEDTCLRPSRPCTSHGPGIPYLVCYWFRSSSEIKFDAVLYGRDLSQQRIPTLVIGQMCVGPIDAMTSQIIVVKEECGPHEHDKAGRENSFCFKPTHHQCVSENRY